MKAVDTSVRLNIGRMRAVFLNKFVMELLVSFRLVKAILYYVGCFQNNTTLTWCIGLLKS